MSNKDISVSEIIDTIRLEIIAVTTLSLILDQEFEILQQNTSDDVFSQLSDKKEEQIGIVDDAVKKRNIMQSNMKLDMNNTLRDKIHDALAESDINLESIESLLSEVKKKNMRNGILINIRKNSINKIIELVTGQSSDHMNSYSKDGKLESSSNSRSIIKI